MEQFKETLQNRLYSIGIYSFVLVGLAILGIFHPTAGNTEKAQSFMAGFNTGLAFVALSLLISGGVKYNKAMKDEHKLKQLYIYEHDERLLYIQSKMGGTAMQIILFGLLAATIAAGFLNQVVYFTLLGALLFGVMVKGVLKIYYTKKAS